MSDIVRGFQMKVEDISVECPHGKGQRFLKDCYLDSATPGHECATVDGGRCKAVQDFRQRYGWRSHRLAVQQRGFIVIDSRSQTHQLYPLHIIYSPLDTEGLTWMATNAFTGERFEVVLHAQEPHRRTPEGDRIDQDDAEVDSAELARRSAQGGYVKIPYRLPIWNAPRRSQWRCTCVQCHQAQGGWSMSNSRGAVPGWNNSGKKLIDPATLKSAGSSSAAPSKPSRYFPSAGGSVSTKAKELRQRIERTQESAPKLNVSVTRKKTDSGTITTADVISSEMRAKTRKREV